MQLAEFRCTERLRVRWSEVDPQKIVFNAHYLGYADIAMNAYWRALALPYEASMQALAGEMFVRKATVEYHASARMDDGLVVGLRCAGVGNSSCRFEAGIFCGERLLVSVELVYVFADPVAQKPQPVPPALRALLQDYEAGAGTVECRTGDWNALGRAAGRLRTAVFVREQGIPADQEADALDASARHAVVFNRLGMPVATGRLVQQAPGVGRIERLAVDRSLRGAQWGRQLLDALVQASRARGDHQLRLQTPHSAEGFFQRAGFTACGEPFEAVGRRCRAMERALA
ncbi:MAG: YbgC/FadM family acyl-CoA thioesterase [Burkholderiaceae bacterium]|nr:YbgC/FadM family acyl-CoA thioesterase [Burkholderiaceae bacterium]